MIAAALLTVTSIHHPGVGNKQIVCGTPRARASNAQDVLVRWECSLRMLGSYVERLVVLLHEDRDGRPGNGLCHICLKPKRRIAVATPALEPRPVLFGSRECIDHGRVVRWK